MANITAGTIHNRPIGGASRTHIAANGSPRTYRWNMTVSGTPSST